LILGLLVVGGHCLAVGGGLRAEAERERGGKTLNPYSTPQNFAKIHVRKTNTYLPDLQPIPPRHRNISYPFKKNVFLFYDTFGFVGGMGINLQHSRWGHAL